MVITITLITAAEPTVTFQCNDSLCRTRKWWQLSLLAPEAKYLSQAVAQWNRIRLWAEASVRQAPKRIITAHPYHRTASSRWNSIRLINARRTQARTLSRRRATLEILNPRCYRLEIRVWIRATRRRAWLTHTTIWPWAKSTPEKSQVQR